MTHARNASGSFTEGEQQWGRVSSSKDGLCQTNHYMKKGSCSSVNRLSMKARGSRGGWGGRRGEEWGPWAALLVRMSSHGPGNYPEGWQRAPPALSLQGRGWGQASQESCFRAHLPPPNESPGVPAGPPEGEPRRH